MHRRIFKDELRQVVDLKSKLHLYRESIADYLDRVIKENNGFPARSFYGESFTYWLLSLHGERYSESLDRLITIYADKDKEAADFHWEFNKYAWVSILHATGNSKLRDLAFPLRFKHTPVTNWTLLRCCTRILANHEVDQALQEVRIILRKHQSASGLIYDDVAVRSLQYHCFSSVLVAEILLLHDDAELRSRFAQSVKFIENMVLYTGDTLYVGRGQQQSFGYGALIYLFALAGFLLKDLRFFQKLERCLSFLADFQRPDGSFPLVMNGIEKGFPQSANPLDPSYKGWYAYNNYFDYLPFLGVMLAKAESVLSTLISGPEELFNDRSAHDNDPAPRYQDANFLVVHRSNYDAVLARPGGSWKGWGFWTNDLPMPYIVCSGKRITPSYGGEQFGRTMYSPQGIPLPLVQLGNNMISMRDGRIWSFWRGNTLVVITPQVILFRSFNFENEQVVVGDRIVSPYATHLYYLFENIQAVRIGHEFSIRHNARVISDKFLRIKEGRQYFWGGELMALCSVEPARANTLVISLEAVK